MSLTVQLDGILQGMASAILPLFSEPTRKRYAAYLNAMVHYTRQSRSELELASAAIPDPEASRLFVELSREEATHYKLAEADLAAMNRRVNPRVPVGVERLREFWAEVPSDQPWQYLGAIHVLENIADHVKEAALGSLASLGLTEKETRFVRTHLVADESHGRRVRRSVEENQHHRDEILLGAKAAGELWVAMHLELLTESEGGS